MTVIDCASNRLERNCEVRMSSATNGVPLPLMVARETAGRAASLCYSLSTDLDSSSSFTPLVRDVARANDGFEVDAEIFPSTGCRITTEKPRDCPFTPTRNLALGAARERRAALLLTATDPPRPQTTCTREVQGCAIRMPSILYIFIIA